MKNGEYKKRHIFQNLSHCDDIKHEDRLSLPDDMAHGLITAIVFISCFAICASQAQWVKSPGASWLGINSFLGYGSNLLVGTGSGIYQTLNNGESWQRLSNGLVDSAVYSLVEKESKVFAGTENGVYRTTNGGSSWTQLKNGFNQDTKIISMVVIGGYILAATEGGETFRSSDDGENWMQSGRGLKPTNVSCLFAKGTNLFAGTTNGLYRSTDSGAYWNLITGALDSTKVSILYPFQSYIFAGTPYRGVFRSADDGNTWMPVNNGLGNEQVSTLGGSADLLAGTTTGIYRSSDYGNSWSKIDSNLTPNTTCQITIGRFLFAGTFYKILRSIDNGLSWKIMNGEFPVGYGVTDIVSNPPNLFVGTTNGLYRTSDTGISWNRVDSGWESNRIEGLRIIDSRLFAWTGQEAYRSLDHGNSWDPVFSSLRIIIRDLTMQGRYLFAGEPTGLFRSHDTGASWVRVHYSSGRLLAVNSAYLFCGGSNGGVYRSADSGKTWTQVNNGLPTENVTGLGTCGRFLFAGLYRRGTYRTSDNGNTWAPVDTVLNHAAVYSFVASGTSFFAAGDGGVYLSQDSGVSWTPINTGLSSGLIRGFSEIDRKIFVGTWDQGVWKRSLSELVPTTVRSRSKAQEKFGLCTLGRMRTGYYAEFNTGRRGFVKLKVFDIHGKVCATLVNSFLNSGTHRIQFENFGNELPQGVYFLVLQFDKIKATLKFML